MILYKTNCYLYTVLLVKSPSFLEEKFSVVRKRKTGRMNPTHTLPLTLTLSLQGRGGDREKLPGSNALFLTNSLINCQEYRFDPISLIFFNYSF